MFFCGLKQFEISANYWLFSKCYWDSLKPSEARELLTFGSSNLIACLSWLGKKRIRKILKLRVINQYQSLSPIRPSS